MNIALHNPYTQICRAEVDEFPGDGGDFPESVPPVTSNAEDTPPLAEFPPAATKADLSAEAVDFSLTAVSPGDETEGSETGDGEDHKPDDDEAPYVLELPEDLQVTDAFRDMLTEQAKVSGLDGKMAGQYVSGVISTLQKAEQDNVVVSTQELRNDWGKDFQGNMQAVKQFSGKIMAKSGLTPEDMAPLQSPKGYRLLYTLMQATGESAYVEGTKTTPSDPAEEARRMLTDNTHPDYYIFQDPTHERFAEVNRKYNRLVGLPT